MKTEFQQLIAPGILKRYLGVVDLHNFCADGRLEGAVFVAEFGELEGCLFARLPLDRREHFPDQRVARALRYFRRLGDRDSLELISIFILIY